MFDLSRAHEDWPAPWRHTLALAIFAAALALRLWVLPVEAGLAFLTFYPATVLAFSLCGTGPGRVMILASAVAGFYVFTPPYWSFQPTRNGVWSVGVFLVSANLIGWVVQRLQATSKLLRSALSDLRRGEQRFESMLEDQTEVICRYEADGTVLYINAAFCRMFGISREAVVGRKWQPVVFPEDLPLVDEQLKKLSPANPVVSIENRIVTSTGEIRWGQFVNRGLFDDAGRLTEVQAVGRDITERKQLEAGLAAAAEQMRDLYDNAPCGYHSLDADGKFVHINATELAWLGCSRDDVIGKKGPEDFYTADSRERFRGNFPAFKATGRIENLEFDLLHRDGSVRRVGMNATAVRDAAGAFVMSRSVMHDITELQRARERLRDLAREQAAMLDNDLVGIVKLVDRRVVWRNRGMDLIFGYGPNELTGTSSRIFYPDDASYVAEGEAAYSVLSRGGRYRNQVRMVRKDGNEIWVDLSGVSLSSGRGESLWLAADITPLKRYQEQVERMAFHDALTGLPNRLLMTDRLTQALALAERHGHRMAVCYLDLDDFKPVNDRHGHAAGDLVLREVARRLRRSVRANDTVCRLGGDEFVLLLTHMADPGECREVLQRIILGIAEPIALGEGCEDARVSASVGVAQFPADGQQPDVLLQRADRALYEAKRLGRGRATYFSEEPALS